MQRVTCRFLTSSVIVLTLLGTSCSEQQAESRTRTLPEVHAKALTGEEVDVLADYDRPAHVFLFTKSDCPISNRYAPEVNRLCEEYRGRGVRFTLVYPSTDDNVDTIRTHIRDYGYTCEAVIDHARRAVALSGATVTPEAAVWAEGSGLVYRGRIDDLYVDFGKQRVEPSQRDLREVLDAILSGEIPPFRSTKAIGCYIEETGK